MKKHLALSLLLLPLLATAETQYETLNFSDEGGSTFLTGIRGNNEGGIIMTGVYTPPGLSNTLGTLYREFDNGFSWTTLDFPSSSGVTVTSTAFYGPNVLDGGIMRLVGSYKTEENGEYDLGLFYEGPANATGTWATLLPPVEEGETVLDTIAHSTHGELIVGNFDTDLATGRAFIYDIEEDTYTELTREGAVSITAYGIWHNGGSDYTIAGGVSMVGNEGLSEAYLVDWNSETQTASNWRTYIYADNPAWVAVTHFNGITTDGNGGYNLTGDWIGVGSEQNNAFFATVPRVTEGGFGDAAWTLIAYPYTDEEEAEVTSGNSVYEWSVIGIYILPDSSVTNGYMATLTRPYLVEGATPLGQDWYASWLGVVFVRSWPWAFQGDLGWFYGGFAGNANTGSWFFFEHPVLDCWLWSSLDNENWYYGQPTGQAEPGWWYYEYNLDPESGAFYFFSEDGQTVIVGQDA